MGFNLRDLVIEKIEFEKMLDFLPYPFLIAELIDGGYHVIYVNQRFLNEVGYECEEIFTMDEWFTKAYPDSQYRQEIRTGWQERFTAAVLEGRDFVQMDALIHTKNNGDIWYEVKSSIQGDLQLAAFVNRHEIIVQQQELKRVNDNKDNILSILTHDLRSPIISLQSLTDLALQKELTQEEFLALIRTLNEKSRKTLDLLDTTLLWAKSNFNVLNAEQKEADILQLVNSILAVYESSLTDKKLSIVLQLNKTTVQTDPDIVTILFRNLLSNAIKFTPDGGTITIGSEIKGKDFILSVQDTGPGLTLQQLNKLRALQILSTMGTKEEKGFGIGLKLCSQLVKKINGELVFESKPGEGTSARIVVHLTLFS
jgi:signal transduction histidine kinase